MHIETFREYCLAKKGVTECFPFDNKTLVFKIIDKVFALADVEEFVLVNLKCDPELAIELREKYSGITGGYHMNKKHWNSVEVNGPVPDKLFFELIDHSYNLVAAKLSTKSKKLLSC